MCKHTKNTLCVNTQKTQQNKTKNIYIYISVLNKHVICLYAFVSVKEIVHIADRWATLQAEIISSIDHNPIIYYTDAHTLQSSVRLREGEGAAGAD